MARHRPRYARGLTPMDSRREQSYASSKRAQSGKPDGIGFPAKNRSSAPQFRQSRTVGNGRAQIRPDTITHKKPVKQGDLRTPSRENYAGNVFQLVS